MGAIAPEVLANGVALSAAVLEQLTGLRVKSSFGLPARATLRFDDIGYSIAAGSTFAIGTTITVQMAAGQKLFTGEVTGVDLQLDRGVPDFVVIADDLSYKMTLGNKIRSFAKMKYSDIVRSIAGEYGLSATVDDTATQYDYVQQTDSDFGFVSEMAERVGFDWWIDERALMFKKPVGGQSAAILTVGEDLRQFSVRASALHPGATKVTGWTPKTKQGLVGQANAAEPGLLPTANLVNGYAKVDCAGGQVSRLHVGGQSDGAGGSRAARAAGGQSLGGRGGHRQGHHAGEFRDQTRWPGHCGQCRTGQRRLCRHRRGTQL